MTSTTVKLRGHFKVVRFKNRGGSSSWSVVGTTLAGHRIRRNFFERNEAIRIRQKLENEGNRYLETTANIGTNLTRPQLSDAEAALDMLREHSDMTLMRAVSDLRQAQNAGQRQPTVAQVVDKYVSNKSKDNLRRRTLNELRIFGGKVKAKLGDIEICKVTANDLEQIIPDSAAPQTRKNYITKFGQVFNWAVRRRYLVKNPADGMSKPRVDSGDNVILSLKQTKAVLKSAYGTPIQNMIALRLFAGFRDNESRNLDWSMIHLDKRRVVAAHTKKRQKRSVEMSENLIGWLDPAQPILPISDKTGKPSSGYADALFRQMRREAGITDRKYDNVLRHTALSFYGAKTGSLDKTIMWGGTGVEPFFNHYRGLVEPEDVDAYWSLTPESLGLE